MGLPCASKALTKVPTRTTVELQEAHTKSAPQITGTIEKKVWTLADFIWCKR